MSDERMARGPAARRDLAREVEALGPWYHNLHLPDGTQTRPDHPLGDFPRYKWVELAAHLPESLSGWTALDVGCNAGFYAFELARRGAAVTAIDVDETYLRQARWAADHCGVSSRIEFRRSQVYDLARREERFDLVLFLGVFYHLRYPLLGLDIVGRLVRRLMAFQTMTMPGEAELDTHGLGLDDRARMAHPGWPKMAFMEHRFADDPTNWWAPNDAAVIAMLRSTGLRVVGRPGTETYLCRPDPDSPSNMWPWNEAEYLAAVGRPAPSGEGS